MKKILSLDGGGAKGRIQAAALRILEERTGRPVCQLFDLILGTSVGSIGATYLSTGEHTAADYEALMDATLPKIFKRRPFSLFRTAKYSKRALRDVYAREMGPDACLGAARTRVIVTSYEDTAGRMHFFKSWESGDEMISMFDAVDRSSAAPIFFGPVVDDHSHRVWLDGGVGAFNNPAGFAYVEAKRQGWKDSHCISLGCGHKSHARSFADASNDRKLGQLLNFVDPADGGLARRNASGVANDFLRAMAFMSDFGFDRIDTELPKKLDRMDGVKYLDEYRRIGEALGAELYEAYIKIK